MTGWNLDANLGINSTFRKFVKIKNQPMKIMRFKKIDKLHNYINEENDKPKERWNLPTNSDNHLKILKFSNNIENSMEIIEV